MDELERLMEGNKKYIEGKISEKDAKSKRDETYNGQKPYATILTCSDSRVVPEHIFDVNLGEIFVIRNAGNIVDPITLGSIEYGVEHLKTPILIVLGHERCGAVTATYKGGAAEGHITNIVEKIGPGIEKVKKGGDEQAEIEEAIDENMKNVVEEIKKRSAIVSKLENDGKLKVVALKYFLKDGSVREI